MCLFRNRSKCQTWNINDSRLFNYSSDKNNRRMRCRNPYSQFGFYFIDQLLHWDQHVSFLHILFSLPIQRLLKMYVISFFFSIQILVNSKMVKKFKICREYNINGRSSKIPTVRIDEILARGIVYDLELMKKTIRQSIT